jgi:hypothetical protein
VALRRSRGILTAWLVAAACTAPEPLTAVGSPPRPIDAADLAVYRSVVVSPALPVEVRRVAATRLLQQGSPADWLLLCRGQAPNETTPGATIFAGAAESHPNLVEAIVAAAVGSGEESLGCLASLLAMSGPSGEGMVVRAILDAPRPLPERIAAVRLLGEAGTVSSAEWLVGVLEAGVAEQDLRVATVAALRSLSGREGGEDPAGWRRWLVEWVAEREGPSCESIVEELSARVDRAERERQRSAERADRIADKLRAAHAAILLGLELPRRQEHLQQLLADDLELLRLFALEQIERMLRDGDQVNEETARRVLDRLADAGAAVRGRAARVLGQVGGASVPRTVSERLVEETDAAVAIEYLRLLAERPAEGSFPALLARLPDAASADAAARALVRLESAGLMPVDWRRRTLETLRPLVEGRELPSSALCRLWALAGDESDRERLLAILASEEPARRRAIAEAWARRGVLEPLLERSGDAAVYPALTAGIVEHRQTIDGLRLLRSTPAPEGSVETQGAAVGRLLQVLPLAELLAADDLLAQAAAAPPAWRLEAMRRVSEASAEELRPADREELLHRYCGLLLEQGRAAVAADLLENETLLRGQRLHGRLFEARILAGRFEQAAAQFAAASAWLDLLAELQSRGDAAAPAVAAEVGRRYWSAMTDPERERAASLGVRSQAEAPPPAPASP